MPRGDSVEALRAIWMEGYTRARRELGSPPPVVAIRREDIERVYGSPCADPEHCPACGAIRDRAAQR